MANNNSLHLCHADVFYMKNSFAQNISLPFEISIQTIFGIWMEEEMLHPKAH